MPDSVGGMHTILLHGVVSASQLRLSAPASLVGANAPPGNRIRDQGCFRYLLLVICTHPFAKEALTLHLARAEGHKRYFDCNLMHCKVLASSHQHLMAEAPFDDLFCTVTACLLPRPE